MTFRPAFAFALAAATVVSTLPAEAGGRWRERDHHRRPAPVERHLDGGELLAIGILGLAAGALIAGALAGQPGTPETPHARPHHREPAWRHPQGHPRPSPDRTYFDRAYFPPAPARR